MFFVFLCDEITNVLWIPKEVIPLQALVGSWDLSACNAEWVGWISIASLHAFPNTYNYAVKSLYKKETQFIPFKCSKYKCSGKEINNNSHCAQGLKLFFELMYLGNYCNL